MTPDQQVIFDRLRRLQVLQDAADERLEDAKSDHRRQTSCIDQERCYVQDDCEHVDDGECVGSCLICGAAM
jgi:hypothetical protein